MNVKHKINIKEFGVSTAQKILKAGSYINDKGEIVKTKYYNNNIKLPEISESEPIEFEIKEFKERRKKNKKPKSKRKGCGCK